MSGPTALLAVDEALEAFAFLDPRKAKVIELHFFGGLAAKRASHAIGVSETTIEDDWRLARAWLHARLGE